MSDPYKTLGLLSGASDAEVRAAYRRLVQLHHPDHNGGSAESARRFEDVQQAYAEVRRLRAAPGARGAAPPSRGRRPTTPPPGAATGLDARLAELERELREANAARERARQAAREAAAAARAAAASRSNDPERASDEELGYVTTDDSLSKILADARDELFGRVSEARESPAGQRVSD